MHWLKEELKTSCSWAEMSIIRQLAKRDHDKKARCTRSYVSSTKNDKNMIQEANSKEFNYYVLMHWLLNLWEVKSLQSECVKKKFLKFSYKISELPKLLYIYVGL